MQYAAANRDSDERRYQRLGRRLDVDRLAQRGSAEAMLGKDPAMPRHDQSMQPWERLRLGNHALHQNRIEALATLLLLGGGRSAVRL
jgi:hypothetical protein